MKKNKVLAVALSAGLVLGGAYALDADVNVAYAAEETKSVEEQKAEKEAQIKELEEANTAKEKEIETLKGQKTDTTQASKDLEEAKTTQTSAQEAYNSENAKYNELETKHQASKSNREQLDQQLKEAREAYDADPTNSELFDKVKQLRDERDAAERLEGEDRVAANNQKKVVDEKKTALDAANTSVTEKQEALNKAEQSNKDNQEKIDALNNEIKANNGKIDELKKEIEALDSEEDEPEIEENNENGFETKAAAREAGIKERDRLFGNNPKTHKVVAKMGTNGRWYYTIEPIEVNPNDTEGYETKEEAEDAAKEALADDPINNSYKVSQRADGRWVYVLSAADQEEPGENPEKPGEDKPGVTIDEYLTKVGMETEELARKQAEDDLKSKGLEDLYDIEVRQGYSNGEYGRWFYRFVPKEEVKEEEKDSTPLTPLTPAEEIEKPVDEEEKPCKPCPVPGPVIPGPIAPDTAIPGPIADETVVIPTTPVTPTPEEKPEEKPSEDIDKLIKDIEQGTKDIKDTLIENEKNQKEEEKKPEEDKKPEDDKKPEENKKPEEKEKEVVAPKAAPKTNNPKTGVAGMSAVAGTLAISMAGIVATRKKNN